MLSQVMLCYAMFFHVVLCCAVSCYVMFYVVLCRAMFYVLPGAMLC